MDTMNDSDLKRLRSLLNTVKRINSGQIHTHDGSGLDTTNNNLKLYRHKADQIILALSDQQLVEVYRILLSERGFRNDTLASEIERRNIHI
ncbi:MAG: hypothetical protein EOO77_32925 [Oxalobacteraceae bacterium]|nr:MAG: hypothetical protein EOO77_32925 [Oxalobacteraceae bacterium]